MDKYEMIAVVGKGSYGVVVKCRNRESKLLVAIKKLIDMRGDYYVKKMTIREIRILKKLHHENIVKLIEVFKRKCRFYLVFEYLERTVLDDLKLNPNGLGVVRTKQYMYQVIRGINYCHDNNIVHRDIKPENLLISTNGILKLCDFGFAKVVTSKEELCTEYVATRWYRAPELLVRDRLYGKPVDIWALGCVFVELITGNPLFPGESDLDQLFQITKLLGKLPARHQKLYFTNVSLRSYDAVYVESRKNIIETFSVLFPNWRPSCLNIIARCLQLDPEKRVAGSELLVHEYFTEDDFALKFAVELSNKIREYNVNITDSEIYTDELTKKSRTRRIVADRKQGDKIPGKYGNHRYKFADWGNMDNKFINYEVVTKFEKPSACVRKIMPSLCTDVVLSSLCSPVSSGSTTKGKSYIPHVPSSLTVETKKNGKQEKTSESEAMESSKNKVASFTLEGTHDKTATNRISFPELTGTARKSNKSKLNSTEIAATHFKQFR